MTVEKDAKSLEICSNISLIHFILNLTILIFHFVFFTQETSVRRLFLATSTTANIWDS